MNVGEWNAARPGWAVLLLSGMIVAALCGPLGAGHDPAEVGQWQAPQPWPVVAIHTAMLPTGKVLHYAYPGGGDGSRGFTWDPRSGDFHQVFVSEDLFCSGHSFLPDGLLYVTGGNDNHCEFQGRFVTHTFDPFSEAWTQLEDMSVGRWYPSNVTLGDGRVLIFSGLNRQCQTTSVVEMYTPGVGIEIIPEAEKFLPLYPRMHVLSDGKVAYVGPGNGTELYDPAAGQWQFVDWNNFGWRGSGTSVLVPGEKDQVMIMGGGNDDGVTNTCEVIHLSGPEPQWQWAAPMNHARAHANAVILPDRTVLIVGGGQSGLYGNPVNFAELYDPSSNTWTLLPPQVYGRMYHSTAVLLPDGRVLSAGQDSGGSGEWGEIYRPAYLYRGPRPVLSAAPSTIFYAQTFEIETPQAEQLTSAALIRLSSVTHSFNFEQRYVGLEIQAVGESTVMATVTSNENFAPRGYYMLFIVDADGVPSVAQIVRLDHCLGDLDGDGAVGAFDLAALLGAWGPNPDHPADLNDDGEVGPEDLAMLLGAWGPCDG